MNQISEKCSNDMISDIIKIHIFKIKPFSIWRNGTLSGVVNINQHLETFSELRGFDKEISSINDVISQSGSGIRSNIAIIGEPFAGKTTLIHEIETMNPGRTAKLSLSSLVKHNDEIEIPDYPIIIIDDCQYLFMRKIGGFDVLEDFLALVARSKNLFITTWNLYSWTYLNEVMDLSVQFPVQIILPKFTVDDVKTMVLSRYGTKEIQFAGEAVLKKNVVELVKHTVTLKLLKKEFSFPFIKIYFDPLWAWFFRKREMITTEDVVFRRIHTISNGNPGVSIVVWENSLDYPVIKPEYINDSSYNVKLDYDEAFVLNLILSMKSATNEELDTIAGFQTVHILSTLSRQDLISIDNDTFRIKPEALKSIVEFLKKVRLVG